MIKIIDNHRIEMTNDEWKAYEEICKAYDEPPAQRGRDLFAGLFETDENGMIVFLRPPHNRVCTFEIYLFMMSLMTHQWLRKGNSAIETAVKKLDEKMKEVDKVLADIKEGKKKK